MKAIYSCKLYRASTRKDKINAAIADPVNSELVAQLKSYLDEDGQELVREAHLERKQAQVDNIKKDSRDSEIDVPADSPSSKHSPEQFQSPAGHRPSLSEKFDMLTSEDSGEHSSDADSLGAPDSIEPNALDDSPLDEIEESTSVNGVEDLAKDDSIDLVSEVKNILDAESISRVLMKKNELWIYYTDDVNLNNIMGPVIEKLSDSVSDYIEFNRLARSDNAIVFQIKENKDGEESVISD